MNEEHIIKFEVGFSVWAGIALLGAVLSGSWLPLMGMAGGFILGLCLADQVKKKDDQEKA